MDLTAPDEVFTSQEAAEFLNKSCRQTQRLLSSGKLAATRPNGRWVIKRIQYLTVFGSPGARLIALEFMPPLTTRRRQMSTHVT